jgi:hypothetical protein
MEFDAARSILSGERALFGGLIEGLMPDFLKSANKIKVCGRTGLRRAPDGAAVQPRRIDPRNRWMRFAETV